MAASDFPREPDGLTAAWLAEQLGGDVTDFALEQIGVGVGLLGRLFRITLQGTNVPASVIAKFPTLDEAARTNVVAPLSFYANEVAFYSEAAAETPTPTPRAYFARFDAASGDFALLLEDLCDRRIEDQTLGCPVRDAEVAIDAMAALHARWWNDDFAGMPWVKSYVDPPYPQVIAGMFKHAWPEALKLLGPRLPERYVEFGERFVDLVPWFMDAFGGPPVTLCHGDFRLDNLFFGAGADHPPLTVVDWQLCFRGRGDYDLGYFMSQSLTTEDRRANESALIDRYIGAMAGHGIDCVRADLERTYAATVAYCFIYPVVAGGQIETANDRQRELLEGMVDRVVAAMDDTRCLAILPS